MQQYRDTDYAAVSAALHAREAKLLTQAMAERMIRHAGRELQDAFGMRLRAA